MSVGSDMDNPGQDPNFLPEVGKRRQLPEKLSLLRQKLGQKAKQEKKFRFYVLYDRIFRKDTLEAAWEQVRRNKGSAGIDGVSINQIENAEGGSAQFLDEIQAELKSKSYKPQPVKRVEIPKPDGRTRPLGIPTIKDRVVQMATLLILEPIFEADFLDCSYGFRPGRSAHQALEEVKQHIKAGLREVYDVDLKGYFDSIPHANLMAGIESRIVDRSVLKLIRSWLKAPIGIPTSKGRYQYRKQKCGTPQGGVISPLLANSYLHWFDKAFYGSKGPNVWANARLVRYADDLVVLARQQGPRLREFVDSLLEGRLGLTINTEKTRIVRLAQGDTLHFLGYSFRYDKDLKGRGHRYLNIFPAKKAVAREKGKLRFLTSPCLCFKPIPALIRTLNRHLQGWSNYFRFGYPRKVFRDINWYVRLRLTVHLKRRSQRSYRPPKGKTLYYHYKDLGLIYL